MARQLAESTIERFRKRLESERDRLSALIEELEEEREELRLSETPSERSPDPNSAEGGSLAFELEKELSVERNTESILSQVEEALERIESGDYGVCVTCGTGIPVARLDALPYTKQCVECARGR